MVWAGLEGFVGYFGMQVGGPDVSDVRRLCQLLWLADGTKPAILVGGRDSEYAEVWIGKLRCNNMIFQNALIHFL